MEIKTFDIDGPKLIKLKSFEDSRGFFVERFKKSLFEKSNLPVNFIQDNFSRSKPGVLRGLHYQWDRPQGKLVTCLTGAIFDVAVDIRMKSPTFGKHIGVELKGSEPSVFWIPAGFAHGFCVLGNEFADVLYKVDNEYNSKGENGILWSDSDLKIAWPVREPVLSSKDDELMTFQEYQKRPVF